jgi:hypothetical protein
MQFKYLLAAVFATLATASPIVPDGCTVAEDGPVARSPSWLDARSPRVSFPNSLDVKDRILTYIFLLYSPKA